MPDVKRFNNASFGIVFNSRAANMCESGCSMQRHSSLKSSRQHPDARNKENLIHAQLNIYVLITVNPGFISIPLIPVCVEKLKQNEKNKMRNYARCLFVSFFFIRHCNAKRTTAKQSFIICRLAHRC